MTATLQATFAEEGYLHLKSYFDLECLTLFEERILDLYVMQARKIGEYRAKVDAIMLGDALTTADRVKMILSMMEEKDKPALYQVQKMFPQCRRIRELFDAKFLELCADLFGGNPKTTLIEGPALFANAPQKTRLLYHWHSEACYYGKRRRFVNVWIPIFGDRTEANGAMAVLPGSHKRVWDASLISEYGGWDKASEGEKNQFWQLEIPENFLTDYRAERCVSKRGDCIIFDRNLVHSSVPNTTDDIAFAIVLRVWDPSDDLALNGDMAATPYGGNIGRADLVVKP